jgi:para-nitrobenzyl esterase
MNRLQVATALAVSMALAALAGCGGKDETPPAATTAPETPAAAAPSAGTATNRLAGTSWRLVKIMSMDDTTHVPDDPSKYTLAFGADGTAQIKADCNQGTGSWKSASASQLEFGVIAATQALCPPDSLHDTYMKQFEWVRSYVIEGGPLFLSTMADGSIIEFEPA